MGKKKHGNRWAASPAELLKVGPDFDLAELDRASTPGWKGNSDHAEEFMAHRGEELSELQERLYADGRSEGTRSVLLVLQGLDTAGKGGIVRHVVGMVDPQGVSIRNFGVPTEIERKHHFLWRVRHSLPTPGKIGVFDRSHYEQVLVVKVDRLESAQVNANRYTELVAFDREVISKDTTVIKVALMVSHGEQGDRLRDRMRRHDKYWKYSPNDIPVREKWDEYQAAYSQMFARTSVDDAPWYVVPADKKWYARLAVTELLHDALKSLKLEWPPADFDPKVELARLKATSRGK